MPSARANDQRRLLTQSAQDFVLSVALTPDGEWVLSGSKDRGVQFWNPRTGDTQVMLQGHKNSGTMSFLGGLRPLLTTVHYLVISVAPSPQGELFATGSGDMRARIWKYVASGSRLCMVPVLIPNHYRYGPYRGT